YVLMGADPPGIQQKRIGHLIAFDDQLAVTGARVSVQQPFIDRVVDDFDATGRDFEELFRFQFGEVGNRENARGAAQDPLGELEIQRPPCSSLLGRTREVQTGAWRSLYFQLTKRVL